jgi:hypothetical protein
MKFNIKQGNDVFEGELKDLEITTLEEFVTGLVYGQSSKI